MIEKYQWPKIGLTVVFFGDCHDIEWARQDALEKARREKPECVQHILETEPEYTIIHD
jgi:hypothetical protein